MADQQELWIIPNLSNTFADVHSPQLDRWYKKHLRCWRTWVTWLVEPISKEIQLQAVEMKTRDGDVSNGNKIQINSLIKYFDIAMANPLNQLPFRPRSSYCHPRRLHNDKIEDEDGAPTERMDICP